MNKQPRKKIQETKGTIKFGGLDEYLINNVSIKSLIINSREQVPAVNVGTILEEEWRTWNLLE